MFDLTVLASVNPVPHTLNHPTPIGWAWSMHANTLILAGLLTVLVMWWAAARIRTGDPARGAEAYVTTNPFAHALEVMCVYLREQTCRPLLGERTDRFMPFLWTLFFFILFNNLLGLVPLLDAQHLASAELRASHSAWLGGTATSNIYVTGLLALIAALVINIAGVMQLGPLGYLKHLTAGTPTYLWPLMVPIEIIGTIIKPVALAIRLFANMTAGHILVATLFMFAGMGAKLGGLGYAITLVSGVAAVGVYFLELFVALLQAFVFMFLTTVFIAQLAHHGEHEHHGEIGHEHAHAH
ncbi:MAG: F0F1 ATP synthase subunit A [Phycisphaerae bacterium]|nr:F0F1 ATP synthase subunit A [Phycisphaerae bacterium]